jgi:hypothetical protein
LYYFIDFFYFHDFLQTIGRLAQERQVMPEQQGKEDVIE